MGFDGLCPSCAMEEERAMEGQAREEEDDDDSMFAYDGFGPACLKIQCKKWGGDGLCMASLDPAKYGDYCSLNTNY